MDEEGGKANAVLSVSKPRHNPTFAGLPLEAKLKQHKAVPRCGLQVIDLESGDIRHWLRIEGVVNELYDVIVLPGVRRPKALGFKTDEIRTNVWFESDGKQISWTARPKS